MIKRRENKAYIVLEIRNMVNGKPKNIKTISLEAKNYHEIRGFVEKSTAEICTDMGKNTAFHIFTRLSGRKVADMGTLTFTIKCLDYMKAYHYINKELDK